MIVNGFSVIAAFAALLRVVVGLLLMGISVRALVRHRRAPGAEPSSHHLLALLAGTLLGLAIVSWPLLYLVLQSYVPEWPGVMCIQGVTRVGAASSGAASHLPGLLDFLEAGKPALVFLAGAWLVLHLVRRGTRSGSGSGRILAVLLLLGVAGAADGAAESLYLFIPKQEKRLATGCCTTGTHAGIWATAAPIPVARSADVPHDRGSVAFHGAVVAAILLLSLALRRLVRKGGAGPWLALALLVTAATVPLGLAFLAEVAAPAFLRLPYHECGYCLIASAPESLAGIALLALGVFGVGWAAVAAWLAPGADRRLVARLVRAARFGFLGALVVNAVRIALP